ncbi:MAG: DNA-directed RNA polymerase subunit omega [Ignavibacteriales bacterium]|nr:DNA-directed RNA polymerase subunit omega [Ignavibacteriales bacterium]
MAIIPIEISELEKRATNVYEAIVVLSKRARQINEEQKIEFNQRLEVLHSKLPEEDSEDLEPPPSPDQIKIGKEFEKYQKPTERAIDDFLNDVLEHDYKVVDTATPTQLI